jgi:hypothetical protein
MLAKVLGRAEAHVARLSLIFAVADCSTVIRPEHHKAAVAVWDYCERSAKWIFHALTGNYRADKVIRALRREPRGMARSAIRGDVFSGHISKEDLTEVLAVAKQSGLADFSIDRDSNGNPQIELWKAK